MDALPKEEGFVKCVAKGVAKEVENKAIQAAATFILRKGMEKLPSLIASLS